MRDTEGGTVATSQRKEVERIIEALERQGWKVRAGGKHWMVYPADKSQSPVAFPRTPSDYRSVKNMIAELRRKGAVL